MRQEEAKGKEKIKTKQLTAIPLSPWINISASERKKKKKKNQRKNVSTRRKEIN